MYCGAAMAGPLATTMLRTKRDQIEGLIAHLEDRLKEARTDLAHVNATLRLFEMDGEAPESVRSYMDLNRVFPRGELRKLCGAAGLSRGALIERRSSHPPSKRVDHAIAAIPGGTRAEPCLTDAAPRGRSRHAVRG